MFLITSAGVGGAETLLVNLVRRLDRRRFAPELCCTKELGPLGEVLAGEIPAFERLLNKKYDLRVLPRLVRLLRRRGTDVVITVGAGDKMFWGRLAAWWNRVPVVISQIHSEGGPDPIGPLNRALTPVTDMFVGVAESHRRLLIEKERFPAGKVCVIPNGVNTEQFTPRGPNLMLRHRLGIPPGPLAGNIARLIPAKNHRLFLEVASRVRRELPSAQFVVVGDGPLGESLRRRAAELGLNGCVHFTGMRSDVPDLLGLLDLFLLTSDTEANPVAVLESLAAGVPVVSTRVGALPEIVPPAAGTLTAPGDAAALGRAVVDLLRDRQRARAMGAAGREHVVRHWSLSQMVEQYEDLIEQLYARKAGPRPVFAADGADSHRTAPRASVGVPLAAVAGWPRKCGVAKRKGLIADRFPRAGTKQDQRMNGLVVAASLVAVIWGGVLMLRMPLAFAAMATVLIGSVIGYAFVFDIDIGGSHWTIDRLLLPLLFGGYFLQRRLGRTDPKPLDLADKLMLGFLAWLTFSLFTHDWTVRLPPDPKWRGVQGNTLDPSPVWRWATAYCIPGMLYWISRQSHVTRPWTRFLQSVLIAFGVYLAVTGILEAAQMWSLVFPPFIGDKRLGIHFGRARGPMLNSMSYGLFLGACFLCLWATRDRWRFVPRWTLLSLLSPLFLAAVYFSYTRSVWMGVGLGMVVVLGLTLSGHTRTVVLGTLVCAAALFTVVKWNDLMSFQRERQTATIVRQSAEARVSFAYVTWQMFQTSPVWGVGFGQFPTAKWAYLGDRTTENVLEPIRYLAHHNTFLSILVETGLIGFGLFIGMMFGWVLQAWRIYRAAESPPWARGQAVLLIAVIGVYVCQLAFHEISYSAQHNSFIFLLAGMTGGIRPATAAAEEAVHAAVPLRPELAFSVSVSA